MMSSLNQLHHLSSLLNFQDFRLPSSTSTLHISSAAKRSRLFLTFCSLPHHQPEPTTSRSSGGDDNPRRHNAKSSSLLLRYLSAEKRPNPQPPEPLRDEEFLVTEEDRVKLLEMSLVRKRTPQFPGSIYVQSSSDPDVSTSLPPIKTLFRGHGGNDIEDDDEMLMKALEIRRKVTVEIFKEALKESKFGITYSTNLVSTLSEFIDYVMIQAASMKQLPEFSRSSFNARARTFIDDSGVIPLVRWLKHNALSFNQIGKLICMSKENLQSIRRLVGWLKSVHVKGSYIGVVLTRAKKNMLNRSLGELNEIVAHLESHGVRMDWMGYVLSRCPEILSFDVIELKSRIEFYLNMGMDEKDFGTMVFDHPKVLGYFPMEEMVEKVAFLKELGLSNEDMGRLLAFKPQLMSCSIKERWKPLIKYFYYLGISKDGMKRILVVKPMVFCIDLESNIVPKVQFLRDVGVKEDAIGMILIKFPQLLTYSLIKKIRPVVIFLLTKAGVPQKDVGKVLAIAPQILGSSIAHKLDHNVKYFLSLGIRLHELGHMIAEFPMLLRYNIDVLRPKYRYLRKIMVRPLQDLIEFPRFFSYSLEDRIIPRHKQLVESRIDFKLRYMLASTDEEFGQKVLAAVQRRQRFETVLMCDQQPVYQSFDFVENQALYFPINGSSPSEEKSVSSDHEDART